MEKNNWKMVNKFFEIEISSDQIFGSKSDVNMIFVCGLSTFKVPKDKNGKLQAVSLLDCIFEKYGKDGKAFADEVRDTAASQGELFRKAVNEFDIVQARFISDINKQRKEAGLPAV